MSYDIRFGVKVQGCDEFAVIGRPEYDSPTYNIGKIFRQSMDWDFTQSEWYPLIEVIPKIEHGIHELMFNKKKYEPLEPDNGWGSVSSALNCLESIIRWCSDEYERGWNTDIPLECIYMCW